MTQHIPIWGEIIPGNSPTYKRSVMEVEPLRLPQLLQFGRMILAATARDFSSGDKSRIDSYTWYVPICNGWEKETFEDIPYIDAFPVRNARQAVLVIPGGAYAYKQSDADGQGKQNEGDRVARALNERGVSAFVLWYRSNPYCFPIPLLDVQRAVRFLKTHADEYGFDPEQLSIIGFSAGGYQSLGFANILRGRDAFPVDYKPDEIDSISDQIQSASAGYPLVSFRTMPNEVLAVMNAEDAGDKEKRESFFRAYELTENIASADLPQFIHYGTKDILVSPASVEAYIQAVRRAGGEICSLSIEGANHGYGANPQQRKALIWIDEYVRWLKEHWGQAVVT